MVSASGHRFLYGHSTVAPVCLWAALAAHSQFDHQDMPRQLCAIADRTALLALLERLAVCCLLVNQGCYEFTLMPRRNAVDDGA